ncbi:MAG: hypothetical protein EB015_22745 [Methylocystaceae bacterium]|nr:hypothetical protein [Methylocystaceae bacterium]
MHTINNLIRINFSSRTPDASSQDLLVQSYLQNGAICYGKNFAPARFDGKSVPRDHNAQQMQKFQIKSQIKSSAQPLTLNTS